MASKHRPNLPGSFSRFTDATSPDDESAEFFTSSGTYAGRNTAPAHKAIAAGGKHQIDRYPVSDSDDYCD